MAQTADIPAWIAFFLGLYSLAAAVGEFRAPGTWRVMLKDMERSAGLRFLTGMFCLVLGLAGLLLGNGEDWWTGPSWFSLVIGAALVLAGVVQRKRNDRRGMRDAS